MYADNLSEAPYQFGRTVEFGRNFNVDTSVMMRSNYSKNERSPTAGGNSYGGDMSSRIKWGDNTTLPSIHSNRGGSKNKKSTSSSIANGETFRREAQRQMGRGRNASVGNSMTNAVIQQAQNLDPNREVLFE